MWKLTLGLLLSLLLTLPVEARAQYLQSFAKFYTGTTVPTVCQTPSVFVSATSGIVYTCQDHVYVPLGVGAGGVLNPSQLPSFVTGTDGTDFNIQFDVSNVIFNLPDASCTARGAVNGVAQIFCGNKTLQGDTLMQGSLYVTDYFSTDHYIEITGEACATSEANVGVLGFDPTSGLPCYSYDGSTPTSVIPRLDQVLDPTADKTFLQTNKQLGFTWGSATGVGINMLTLQDTAGNTGTGDLVRIQNNAITGNNTLNIIGSPIYGPSIIIKNHFLDNFTDAASGGPFDGSVFSATSPNFYRATYDSTGGMTGGSVESCNAGVVGTGNIDIVKCVNSEFIGSTAASITDVSLFDTATSFPGNTNTSIVSSFSGYSFTQPNATSGGGAYTTLIGLNVHDVTRGGTNYAIKTGLGQVDFGDTIKGASTINAVTGFQNDGAATSGNCLVGNGTNFVDATCPGGGAGVGTIGSGLLSGGGVTWTGNLNFTVSAAEYLIAGNSYTSAQTDITLDAANGSNPRIDVFAANDAGAIVKITGTPATPAAKPSIDPTSQIELGFAYVDTLATIPSNFSNVNIYLENTEWTTVRSPASDPPWALASTNNPFAGSVDIEATTAAATNFVSFTKPAAGTENLSTYATVSFRIRSKAVWANPKSLVWTTLNGTTQVGSPVAVKSGTFGFDSSITASYQLVVLPVSLFNTGANLITTFKAAVAGGGGSIGFYIDNVLLQTAADGSSDGAIHFVDMEVPTGAINDVNTTYVLSHVPNPSTSTVCFLNGLAGRQGASNDFTVSLSTVEYNSPPSTNDSLACNYRH